MSSRDDREDVVFKKPLKFITFGLGREKFGVPIDEVKEIIASYEIVPLPKAPGFIEGIISLRGEIIPVVDMRKRFDMPGSKKDEETRLIILNMKSFIVGIQVDTVQEVLKLHEDKIDPPPMLVAGLKTDYLKGVSEVNGRLLIILNMEEIFSTTEKIVMKEGLAPVMRKNKRSGVVKKGQRPESGKVKAGSPEHPSAALIGLTVSPTGQISLEGKHYYIGKKYKGCAVRIEERDRKLLIFSGDEKIKEFELQDGL